MDSRPIPDPWIIAKYHIQVPIPHWTSTGSAAPAVELLEMQRIYDPNMHNKAKVNIVITASVNQLGPYYLIIPTLVHGQGQAGDVCVTAERGVCPVGEALLVFPVTYAKDGISYTINHQYLP